jgi:hypothetical protein
MIRIILGAVLGGLMLASCTIINRPPTTPPPKTQLQIREYQTREFDTNDVKLVMKAMLNVLQDDGFVVKNAVMDLGLITATKEIDLGTTSTGSGANSGDDYWGKIFETVFKGSGYGNRSSTNNNTIPRYGKFKQVEASINVSELGRRCKVRANFQAKILDNQGQPMDVYVIEDQKFYQEFFAKVDQGIFIQKQGF